jgi:hypothetical protein
MWQKLWMLEVVRSWSLSLAVDKSEDLLAASIFFIWQSSIRDTRAISASGYFYLRILFPSWEISCFCLTILLRFRKFLRLGKFFVSETSLNLENFNLGKFFISKTFSDLKNFSSQRLFLLSENFSSRKLFLVLENFLSQRHFQTRKIFHLRDFF